MLHMCAGSEHVCYIESHFQYRAIQCWGSATGTGTWVTNGANDWVSPEDVPGSFWSNPLPIKLSCRGLSTCVLWSDSHVRCFGAAIGDWTSRIKLSSPRIVQMEGG